MKNILLISPRDNTTLDNDIYPRMGLLLLGTILEQKGYRVKIVHMVSDKVDLIGLKEILISFKPEVVGITSTTYQVKWSDIVSKTIKQYNKNINILIGGPHPSALGSNLLKDIPSVDTIIVGEAETFIEQALNSKIPTISSNPLENLDELPFPNLDLVNLKNFSGPYPIGRLPTMYIFGSRGCSFNCSFCFKYTYSKKVRYHSPKYILDLMDYFVRFHNIREITLGDETLNINRKWFEEILEGIISRKLNKVLTFRGALRADEKLVDLELLKLLKRANFWNIFYGVESGNQYMLDRMGKNISLEEIRRAFKLTKEVGLKTTAPFIIGLPGETEDTIKDSIKLARELKAFSLGFGRAQPLPRTRFREEVKQKGHLLPIPYKNFSYSNTCVRTDELTSEELEKWSKHCDKIVLLNLMEQCLLNPTLLPTTLKTVGIKEVLGKVYKNFK